MKRRDCFLVNLICLFICSAGASFLATPPQSALVVAFEDTYDLSLLANTLSDQGIDTTLIVPSTGNIDENLVEVEVLKIFYEEEFKPEANALKACEQLLSDKKILKRVRELQPTFTIFPSIRHDACLIPWVKSIKSIPVLWTLGSNEELYTFLQTGSAIPINNEGFMITMISTVKDKLFIYSIRNNYIYPAMKLVSKYLPNTDVTPENLYQDVELILWGNDVVFNTNFAPLTELVVEVGCFHCRGVQALPDDLQKELVELRSGTIVSLLDESHLNLMIELAKKLPQGRQGQALVWRQKNMTLETKPENLFVHEKVDRQDLIGYPRTRVLLCHCEETELLEAAFHGTPVICFPRNFAEKKNALNGLKLGFIYSTEGDYSIDRIQGAVNEIHNSAMFRENARKVSLALRDRPTPAMDRLVFWLKYIGRIRTEADNFLLPVKNIHTYGEVWQFFYGTAVGTMLSVFITMLYFATRFAANNERQHKSRGKYKR